MALRIADDDQKYNPGQTHSDEQFNNTAKKLRDSEESGDFNKDNESVQNAEKNPASSWKNNVTSGSKRDKKTSRFSIFKKKGPLATIIISLALGGTMIGGLLSPGLLIVHLKEVMVSKFNNQLASMDVRTTKILATKMGTTSGVCTAVIDVRCKYSSMSDKQIANFEKAGIKVNSESTTLLGRAKPTSFEYNGETIKASEFARKVETSTEFRSAIKNAYNPKFAGFADSIWKKVAYKLKLSKSKITIDGDTNEDKLKKIQESTKNGILPEGDTKVEAGDLKKIKEDGSKEFYTAEEAAKINTDTSEVLGNMADEAENIAESGKKLGSVALTGITNTAINSIKITGFVDNACTGYTTIQAVGYAAKAVRTVQLARYALIFLNVADQIKAGKANAEDVSYLGSVLTAETSGENAKKSATDSFGYKYTAYDEAGSMPISTTQFLAAGGLSGAAINSVAMINNALKGTPKTTCGILSNPFVGGVSAVGGLLLAIFTTPFAGVGWVKIGIQAAEGLAINIAIAALPAMLADIVAGVLVDDTTIGEDAGDAITSGASGMMGSVANAGGNAPLTPTQAVAYSNLSNQVALKYDEEENIKANQFDITNSKTFLGSIFTSLIPYVSKMSSLSNTISSITSLTLNSFSTLSPISKAANSYDYMACQDFDYNHLRGDGDNTKLATDPFCNVTYGIPAEALEIEPTDVLTKLIEPDTSKKRAGEFPQIDSITGEPIGQYAIFVNDCINRNRPLGDRGEDNGSTGAECIFGENILIAEEKITKDNYYPEISINNKYYYLHYIDQRVQKGMDGEDSVLSMAMENGLNSISFFDENPIMQNVGVK